VDHQVPEREIRYECIGELPEAAAQIGSLVVRNGLLPLQRARLALASGSVQNYKSSILCPDHAICAHGFRTGTDLLL
jgi:hypothetical protein